MPPSNSTRTPRSLSPAQDKSLNSATTPADVDVTPRPENCPEQVSDDEASEQSRELPTMSTLPPNEITQFFSHLTSCVRCAAPTHALPQQTTRKTTTLTTPAHSQDTQKYLSQKSQPARISQKVESDAQIHIHSQLNTIAQMSNRPLTENEKLWLASLHEYEPALKAALEQRLRLQLAKQLNAIGPCPQAAGRDLLHHFNKLLQGETHSKTCTIIFLCLDQQARNKMRTWHYVLGAT